jgi:uncharacterized protein YqgQ
MKDTSWVEHKADVELEIMLQQLPEDVESGFFTQEEAAEAKAIIEEEQERREREDY